MYEMEGPRAVSLHQLIDCSICFALRNRSPVPKTRADCRSPDCLRVAEVALCVVPVSGDKGNL